LSNSPLRGVFFRIPWEIALAAVRFSKAEKSCRGA
jgi:hypothetical protein